MVATLFQTNRRSAPLGNRFLENTKYGLSPNSISLQKCSLFQSFLMLYKKLNNLNPIIYTAKIN